MYVFQCYFLNLSHPLLPPVSTSLFSFSLDKHFGFTIAILFHWNYKISSKHKWVNKQSEGKVLIHVIETGRYEHISEPQGEVTETGSLEEVS